ncbi:hypothetical protein JYT28_00065 [Desulfobulbus sp. AH-315-M07]|nr:hypothetical protein [Desulfobulbus sp. AH-315-M07]
MDAKLGGSLVVALLLLTACGGDTPAPQVEAPQVDPSDVAVGSFSAQIPDYTLSPGEEAEPCWIFPLEITGPSRIVGGAKLITSSGLHHGNLTTRPKTGEGIRECGPDDIDGGGSGNDIAAGGSFIFASSTQVAGEERYDFPAGHGYRVKDEFEIVARMHYLNPSSEPVTVAPYYEWYTIDEATVEHVLNPMGFIYSGFEIAPLTTKTVTGNCEIPTELNIVTLLPHMHGLGTEFRVEYMGGERDGVPIIDSPGYDPDQGVLTQFDPAIDLSQGAMTAGMGLRFSCTWNNTFDKTIVEGIGDNEMCMLFGYGYAQTYFGLADDAGCLVIPIPPN